MGEEVGGPPGATVTGVGWGVQEVGPRGRVQETRPASCGGGCMRTSGKTPRGRRDRTGLSYGNSVQAAGSGCTDLRF